MRSAAQTRVGQYVRLGAKVACLFAVLFFYVLLRIQPHLLHLLNPVIFLADLEFFLSDFAARPGGAVQYVSAFLTACLVNNWLATLVLAALIGSIFLTTRLFFDSIAGVNGWALPMVLTLLILALLGQYIHVVELCVGLLVVSVSATVHVRMGSSSDQVRLAAFLAGSVLVYYLAAGLFLVYAALCGIFELGVKRYVPIVIVLCAPMIPLAGASLFDLNSSQTWHGLAFPYRHWLAIPSSQPVALTFWVGTLSFLPVGAIAALVWRHRTGSSVVKEPETEKGQSNEIAASLGGTKPLRAQVIRVAVVVALTVAVDVVAYDSAKSHLLQMAWNARRRNWRDVLYHVERLPESDVRRLDVRTGFHINRALYFSGELLDRMFEYPQTLNAPTLTLAGETIAAMAQSTPGQCSEIFFELGRVNESEHMAYESLEIFGNRPDTLKRLVYLNVLTGKQDASRRYLALLDRSMLHADWARQCRQQLAADPELGEVPIVAARRQLMVTVDSVNQAKDEERLLLALLERAPQNRMAFEYLMAHYLLTRDIEKLVGNLHRFGEFGVSRYPRHCQEALVIHLATGGTPDVDLGEAAISPETWRRRGEFAQALQRFSAENAAAAYNALREDFSDSYFFFGVFGRNSLPSD